MGSITLCLFGDFKKVTNPNERSHQLQRDKGEIKKQEKKKKKKIEQKIGNMTVPPQKKTLPPRR